MVPHSAWLCKSEDEDKDVNMLTGTREGSLRFYNEKMLSGDKASAVTTGLLILSRPSIRRLPHLSPTRAQMSLNSSIH